MKKLFFLLFLTSSICFSQEEIKFKKGVKIVESFKDNNFKTPKSILFEFKGETHLINYYLNLSKTIKKRFKKAKIHVDFNYNLTSEKPLKSDLNNVPKNKFNSKNYDLEGVILTTFIKHPKSWKKYKSIKHRKIQHYLNFVLSDSSENKVFSCKLNIHSYFTINTLNKKTSKALVKLITN